MTRNSPETNEGDLRPQFYAGACFVTRQVTKGRQRTRDPRRHMLDASKIKLPLLASSAPIVRQ